MLARSAFKPRRQNAHRPAWKAAEAYKQWLRGRPCACCGRLDCCEGPIVAAHVDHAGDKGMGTKVADRNCIPLSDGCHRRQHSIGWKTFERDLPCKDAVKLASLYWHEWPGRAKWERENG